MITDELPGAKLFDWGRTSPEVDQRAEHAAVAKVQVELGPGASTSAPSQPLCVSGSWVGERGTTASVTVPLPAHSISGAGECVERAGACAGECVEARKVADAAHMT